MGLSRGNLTQQRLERKEIFETNGSVTYLFSQDTVNPVYNPLRDLVGIYVEIVN